MLATGVRLACACINIELHSRRTISIDSKTILIAPKRIIRPATQRRNQIVKGLATHYDGHLAVIRRSLPMELEHWGKVKISGGGETTHAAELVQAGGGHRDATYARVSNTVLYGHKSTLKVTLHSRRLKYTQRIDRLAHHRNLAPDFQMQDFYGRLLAIYVAPMKASVEIGIEADETLLLAAIQTLKVVHVPNLATPFYKHIGIIEVVDLMTIQCVGGRAKQTQGGWWGNIDRSGPLAEAVFID